MCSYLRCELISFLSYWMGKWLRVVLAKEYIYCISLLLCLLCLSIVIETQNFECSLTDSTSCKFDSCHKISLVSGVTIMKR